LAVTILIVLVALAVTPVIAGDNHESFESAVKLRVDADMKSSIHQGVMTVKNRAGQSATRPAPVLAKAHPSITWLKMDKMNSRYVENKGEVYDRVTNLTWSRCSFGQQWVQDKGCVGKVRQLSFDQAQKFSSNEWRLPTKDELSSLIDRTKKYSPEVVAVDSIAFPDMDLNKLYYWTKTEEDNSFAWAVLFLETGIPSILYRSHHYAVRMVHTGR
jgi:hypothetical protein